MKKMKKTNWIEVFHVFFIMILCFATLLTTMLARGAVIVGSDNSVMQYTADWRSVMITLVLFISYMVFVLSSSVRELKKISQKMYDDRR